ncbi:DegT/DnrJ/EryC1/StrS family aminotransferase [Parapedobacter soli]|uniref:DegT/DnrJ/EryC1/StrS family aminotransferase n=1 Tax=Parapedobacter soli TaxID=416955 RepID=UPI0021C88843|nr:aminotransferase class I/II-fold pyridoxal phosphate-dependent enzyme [Parapedobacter soli]
MNPKIWLSSPHMGSKEFEYVKEAFDTNWIAPLGPHVNGFEQDIATRLGHGVHVAALSAGTAALHLALIQLGVQYGDEVICQSMTFSASANPIKYQGAIPVFVDSESDTWNMDPEVLRETIRDRFSRGKKPKAIIVVHLYGMPAKMDEILAVAKEFDIPVIEDAAEALGSMYKGRAAGTFGDFGILSFNGNKIITTSGGGALVSKSEEAIRHTRFLATQARDSAPHYQHSHVGYNYRMSNVCAGIGRGQMEVLTDRVNRRREINQYYREAFKDLDGITFLSEPSADYYSNFWLTTVLVDHPEVTREDIRLALEADNIESRPLWKPMHLQPVFEDAPFYGDGTSERLFEKGLCLPSGSNLIEDDLQRVVKIVRRLFVD